MSQFIDTQHEKQRKRKELIVQVDDLLHEFKNMIHTSQICSDSTTEQLAKTIERLEKLLSVLVNSEESVSKTVLVSERTLSDIYNCDRYTIQDTHKDLLVSREGKSSDQIQTMKLILGQDNAFEWASPVSLQPRSGSKKDELCRIIDQTSNLKSENEGSCESVGRQSENVDSRSRLKCLIESANRKFETLDHSVYEIMTSLDELSVDNSLEDIRKDKAIMLKDLRERRGMFHANSATKEARIRSLASRAAECRSELGRAIVSISRVNSIADSYLRTRIAR